ncbi:hypothetical protein V6N11_071891 [Hibiscus sabdariffa]|uniref:Uncharacterized protein n=2 Tax=Hibiscus sabdariffa TaxID=183260 RepID=A0ABR2AL93_9ROSI
MDANRKKSRPGIVYAPKVESDGNGKGSKAKDHGVIKGKAVVVTLVDQERRTKGEASKEKEDCLAVAIEQSGHLATPKAKSKSGKHSLKEKSEGNNLKKLKKEKGSAMSILGWC